MSPTKFYSIITTIQGPTPAVRGLCRRMKGVQGRVLVVADKKGPAEYPVAGTELISLEAQLRLPLQLPALLPINHYVRKNAGYLIAISRGAECIYETDDDNCPLPGWDVRAIDVPAKKIRRPGWCNVYRYFSDDLIWPRGLPLERIKDRVEKLPGKAAVVRSPIQQGLANGSPDVDAVWRLVLDKPLDFHPAASVALMPGVWCPFNSQTTWWWPEAYPLMYLPSFCTFRMTDIWRSFVAQRCLWEMEGVLTFHEAEAVQKRNPHNLFRDFRDEVPGYLANEKIREVLEGTKLASGAKNTGANLLQCYEALVGAEIFPRKELSLVKAWLKDLVAVRDGRKL